MASWQIQEAEQKLSRLVDLAESEGPQIITRHGAEIAVVLTAATYRELTRKARPSLKDVLLAGRGEEGEVDALLAAIPTRGQWQAKPPEPSVG